MRHLGKFMSRAILAIVVTGCLGSAAALAQQYPTKPIKMIIPYPAGGSSDMIGRVVAHKLSEFLGQPVIVDNRAGAGGKIGIEAASKAQPDGYTLGLGSLSTLSMAPSLYTKLPYDPIRSFEPISLVFTAPFLIVVNNAVQAASIKELIDLDRSDPGKLNFGSVGVGTILHFAGEHFNAVTGTRLVHVPFKGAAPALVALLSGDVQLMIDQLASFQLPNIQSGKLRALAVTGSTRLPQLPSVPTMAEAGFPEVDESVWFGLIAPAGTPKEVINFLNAKIQMALEAKDVVDILVNKNALILGGGTPEQFAALIKNDMTKWSHIVKNSGFKPE